MIVSSAPLAAEPRSERIPAAQPVTYVSLTDLLTGDDAHSGQRQALIALLQQSGKLSARVVETRADGLSVLEFGSTRAALRLSGTHALGELLTVMLADAPEPAPSATVTLSRSATLVNELEKSKFNHILTEEPALQPLVESKASPKQLAAALKHAVRESGLFYEAHLRGWLDGRMALGDIRNEPQARMMEHAAWHAGDAGELLPPRLEYLVRQQLDVLARGAIEWQGLVWPDQPAAIAIHDEPHSPTQGEGENARTWRVRLQLAVPTLGNITAEVALRGENLSLRLQGGDAVLPAMKHARHDLANALGAHGVAVAPIEIRHGD